MKSQVNVKIQSVPVLQLFGRSMDDAGRSVCVNVHGCFPYIYTDYPCDDDALWDVDTASTFIFDLFNELVDKLDNCGCLLKIILVKGRNVYGYSMHERPFLKLFFLSTFALKAAVNLFQTTKVVGRKFKVYEAHIPWELQFMMDHNLYGMGTVKIAKYSERKGGVNQLFQTSKCDMEIDVMAEDIVNKRELQKFRNSRKDASGLFPRSHFMPSVVEMLESMELDATTQSQDPVKPDAKFILRDTVDVDLSGVPINEKLRDFCRLLPEACDHSFVWDRPNQSVYLFNANPAEFDWASSPLGGALFNTPLALSNTSSSPVKSPTKRLKGEPDFEPLFPPSSSCSEDEDLDDKATSGDHPAYSSSLVQGPLSSQNLISRTSTAHDLSVDIDSQLLSSQITKSPTFKRRPKGIVKQSKWFKYDLESPSTQEMIDSFTQHGIPACVNEQPYFTSPLERTAQTSHVAGCPVDIPICNIDTLPPWSVDYIHRPENVISCSRILRPLYDPPKCLDDDLRDPCDFDDQIKDLRPGIPSIYNVDLPDQERVCMFSVEILAHSSGKKLPDPEKDPVLFVFYTAYVRSMGLVHGAISTIDCSSAPSVNFNPVDYITVDSEEALLDALINTIMETFDADILVGYDVQRSSFGYLQERARIAYKYDFSEKLSRRRFTKNKSTRREQEKDDDYTDEWAQRKTSVFQVYGRIVLNTWRVMRSDLEDLTDYSFEPVYWRVFNRHQPKYLNWQLLNWIADRRLVDYHLHRTAGSLGMLIETQVFTRTCEFARLFGVDFFSIVSRGSQFKVEAMLLRLGHLESFIFPTPSKAEIVKMRAPECLQLIMEPEGRWYTDPVVVLDFQSLYPSVMIAHNFCFSTCLGRQDQVFPRHIGCFSDYHLDGNLKSKDILTSVNKVQYVKKTIREGLLSKMLTELLDARIKIKSLMKTCACPRMRKVLDARQLGIKYILNVSYGYTAASFSGRMPCVDIADSIVATGRACLEMAIGVVEREFPNARVIYGDTDSLFVLLKDISVSCAFQIGNEMASKISELIPHPMALKFEKVYSPACLMAKKRYCGLKWLDPVTCKYEGKGVETVRRDGCALTRMLFEQTCMQLFTNPSLSTARKFVQAEFVKIRQGHYDSNMALYVISRQVKQLEAYKSLPPSALIAKRRQARDRMDRTEYNERIPFIVGYVKADAQLQESVFEPEDFFHDPSLVVNHAYYARKQYLASIERVFILLGIDVNVWWEDACGSSGTTRHVPNVIRQMPKSMQGFVKVIGDCMVCGARNTGFVCAYCKTHRLDSLNVVLLNISLDDQQKDTIQELGRTLCMSHDHLDPQEMCWSINCPLFWQAVVRKRSVDFVRALEFLLL